MATVSSTPIRSNEPFSKEPLNQSIERDLQSNRIPTDKEDPLQSTKALPFASTNEQECEDLIKSGSEPSISQQAEGTWQGKEAISHNGNVLDRTMDQIRGWVQSFKSEPQYEEYEIEVDDAEQSVKQSAAQSSDSAKKSLNQAGASAKQTINQASESAKSSLNQAAASASNTAASAKQSLNQAAASASSSAASAKQSVNQAANQASNKLGQVKDSAAGTINQLSSQASNQAQIASSKLGSLKDQVVHTVSDLSASVSQSISEYSGKLQESLPQVRDTVNEYISSSSIPQAINENIPAIPSTDQIRESASRMLPPLAQQASSSWAFAGSFLAQYMQNMKQFMLALRQQNAVMLTLTAVTFINHFVVPWFFLDKSAARSVIYSYVLASLAAHATFFLSGHLRYQWLGHLLFVPMVMSLFFNQGFREAGDVAELIDSFKHGDRLGTAVSAPFSLRSYLFVLWMRGILMNQAVLSSFDLVNVMDLLGLNMDTRLGEEMPLIQGSVKNFRRQLAASVHGAAESLDVSAPSHRGHGRKRRGSAQSNHPNQQNQQRGRHSPAPQQQSQSQQQAQSQQHWVKKSNQSQDSGNNQPPQQLGQQSAQNWSADKSTINLHAQPKSDDSIVFVESHERQNSNELRQRHTAQSVQ